MGVLLRAELTGHGHSSPSAKKALKRTPVQDFNYFSMMFCYIISTTYKKVGDLFYPVIFLDFHTVILSLLHLKVLFDSD